MTTVKPFRPCPGCGKRMWTVRAEAERIVVNAKISYSLYGNKKRREQRVYECDLRPGAFHVTSQEEREPGQRDAVMPGYDPADDEAARAYLSKALFWNDSRPWDDLFGQTYAAQTLRVLGAMHQDSLLEGAKRRKGLEHDRRRKVEGQLTNPAYYRLKAAHEEWVQAVAPMREILVARLRQGRDAIKQVNLAVSNEKNNRENNYHRAAVRRLGLMIARHRERTDAPTAADRELWAALETLVPFGGSEPALIAIQEMLDRGSWAWEADDARPLGLDDLNRRIGRPRGAA